MNKFNIVTNPITHVKRLKIIGPSKLNQEEDTRAKPGYLQVLMGKLKITEEGRWFIEGRRRFTEDRRNEITKEKLIKC